MLGRTDASYQKHFLLSAVIRGQCFAWRASSCASLVLVDLTAGDGKGVVLPQPDFFLDALSWSTPEILQRMASEIVSVVVVLCEAHAGRRIQLQQQFPQATVLAHSDMLLPVLKAMSPQYSLVLSDPNGLRGHNIAVMEALAAQRWVTDFVCTFNENAWQRVMGLQPPLALAAPIVHQAFATQAQYRWMGNPQCWRRRLHKTYVARTRHVMHQSNNFRYRVLVVSNFLSQVITRKRHTFWEVFS